MFHPVVNRTASDIAAGPSPARVRSRVAAEDDAQIIRRHGDGALQREPMFAAQRRDLVEIANTPFGIARLQALVERRITRRGVLAALAERPIEIGKSVV